MEVARALRENIEDANMQLGGVTLVRYLFHLFANGVEEPALAAKDEYNGTRAACEKHQRAWRGASRL